MNRSDAEISKDYIARIIKEALAVTHKISLIQYRINVDINKFNSRDENEEFVLRRSFFIETEWEKFSPEKMVCR